VTALTGKGCERLRRGGNTIVMAQPTWPRARSCTSSSWAARRKGAEQQLTQLNEAALADVKFGEYEQFSFTGANGDTVYGHVMKPWNASRPKVSGRLPGARRPAGQLRQRGATAGIRRCTGAGYATVFIDFHGSTGYGQKFTDSISGDWGGKPLEDLQKAWPRRHRSSHGWTANAAARWARPTAAS
jgi:dipeptidyl aminopeptidase/acylaminoacyl peptidase